MVCLRPLTCTLVVVIIVAVVKQRFHFKLATGGAPAAVSHRVTGSFSIFAAFITKCSSLTELNVMLRMLEIAFPHV